MRIKSNRQKKYSTKLYRCECCSSVNEKRYIKSNELNTKVMCFRCKQMMTISSDTIILSKERKKLSSDTVIYRQKSEPIKPIQKPKPVSKSPKIEKFPETQSDDERVYRIFWKLTDPNDPTKKKRVKHYSDKLHMFIEVQNVIESLSSISKRSRIRPKLKYERIDKSSVYYKDLENRIEQENCMLLAA